MSRDCQLLVRHNGRPVQLSARLRHSGDDLVVFLHGLGCAKEAFDGAFDIPLLNRLSLCAIDLPAHGRSARLPAAAYQLETIAGLVADAVRQLKYERLVLVGHSLSGAIGLLAAQNLDRLAAFVSIEGNLISEDCGMISRNIAAETPPSFAAHGFQALRTALHESPATDLQTWSTWLAACDPTGLQAIATSLVQWCDGGELLAMFERIPYRSYVHGDNSALDYLWPSIHGTPVYAVSKAGHFPMIDNVDGFYRLLHSLLNKALRTTSPVAIPA